MKKEHYSDVKVGIQVYLAVDSSDNQNKKSPTGHNYFSFTSLKSAGCRLDTVNPIQSLIFHGRVLNLPHPHPLK